MKGERNYDELATRYMLIFDEGFPCYLAPGSSEEQMDIMERCLKEGKPYDPYAEGNIDPDANY